MKSRSAALIILLALAGTLAGCVGGTPEPTPTPTGFSSEADAFAAAEATYRAYVDALNQIDLSDPSTFEPAFALTTGDANAAARRSFSQMHADGWTVGGKTVAESVTPRSTDTQTSPTTVSLDVCENVSTVTLTDREGVSQVSSSRPDVQRLRVIVEWQSSESARWKISKFNGREEGPACAS